MNETAAVADTAVTQGPSTGAPKIPKAPPPTYAELLDAWDAITKKRNQLLELQAKEDDVAEMHKSAKRAVEACQDELNNLIDDHNRPDPTLFRSAEQDKADANKGAPAKSGSDEQAQMDAEDGKGPNAWRGVDIAELLDHGMQDRVLGLLRAANLGTLGDLAEAESGGEARIPGIGKTLKDNLDRALTKFWAKHPGYCNGKA